MFLVMKGYGSPELEQGHFAMTFEEAQRIRSEQERPEEWQIVRMPVPSDMPKPRPLTVRERLRKLRRRVRREQLRKYYDAQLEAEIKRREAELYPQGEGE